MSPFDAALALSDDSAFAECGEAILVGTHAVTGVVSPESKGQQVDQYGGISRTESLRVEVRLSDLTAGAAWGGLSVGMPVTINLGASPGVFRIVFMKNLGSTLALHCESTAGTGRAEF